MVTVNVDLQPKPMPEGAAAPPDTGDDFHIDFAADDTTPVTSQPELDESVVAKPEAQPGTEPTVEPEPVAGEPELELDEHGNFVKPVRVGRSEYKTPAELVKAQENLVKLLEDQAAELGRVRQVVPPPNTEPDEAALAEKEALEMARLAREDPAKLRQILDDREREADNAKIRSSISFTNDPDGWFEQKMRAFQQERVENDGYINKLRDVYGPERFDALAPAHDRLAKDVFGYVNEKGVRVPPRMGRAQMLHLMAVGESVEAARMTGREPIVVAPVVKGSTPGSSAPSTAPRSAGAPPRKKEIPEADSFGARQVALGVAKEPY